MQHKIMKKVVVFILSISLLLNNIVILGFAASNQDITFSDNCGDYAIWTLYNDGKLIINGYGAIEIPIGGELPFSGLGKYADSVRAVIIEQGITSIGTYAFAEAQNLEEIFIPDSIQAIYEGAFYNCSSLRKVHFAGTKDTWYNIQWGDGTMSLSDPSQNRIEIEFQCEIPMDGSASIYDDSKSERTEPIYNSTILPTSIGVYENESRRRLINFSTDNPLELEITTEQTDGNSRAILTYDSAGKLVQKEATDGQSGIHIYTAFSYNAEGHLSGWTVTEGETTVFQCEYDAFGRRTRVTSTSSYVTTVEDYSYDETGHLQQKVETEEAYGMQSVRYYSYEYDEMDRVKSENCTDNGRSNTIIYNYENAPFVLCRGGTYGDGVLILRDGSGNEVYSLYVGNANFHKNEHGLLQSAIRGNIRFEFHYSGLNDQSTSSETREIAVFADNRNLCVQEGFIITVCAGIKNSNGSFQDPSQLVMQLQDSQTISLINTVKKDNCVYFQLKGKKNGSTEIRFIDAESGQYTTIPISVFTNKYHSYTLSSVPTQRIEKYETNIYNANGLYIDSYAYELLDHGKAKVSFDVYNSKYTKSVVEVYSCDGILLDAIIVQKMSSNNTSVKEAFFENLGYLLSDIGNGDVLTYRQQSGFSKKSSISAVIPENGYIKISNDPMDSGIVNLINSIDIMMSVGSIAKTIDGYDVNSDVFSEQITKKLVMDKAYIELMKDGSNISDKLWKNVNKGFFNGLDSLGTFSDTVAKNISELQLDKIVLSTAESFGWNLGENLFAYFAGPFGMLLKGMFTLGELADVIAQFNDLSLSAGVGSIIIQNQGGGIRAVQQIKVESKQNFSDKTSLSAYEVSIDPDVLEGLKNISPALYDSFSKGLTFSYNISLLESETEIQPNGIVTVFIPIPEELTLLAYAGKVKVYRWEDNNTLTELETRIDNGYLKFITNHFSTYSVVGSEMFESEGPVSSSSSSFDQIEKIMVITGMCCLLLVFLLIIALIVLLRRSHRRKRQ